MKVAFVDKITLWSLVRVCALGSAVRSIRYFAEISPSGQQLLSLLRKCRLIRAVASKVEHQISEARTENGESLYLALLIDVDRICAKIKQERLATNPLIGSMDREWALNKVLLYFMKQVEFYVQTECLRIGLTGWMLRSAADLRGAGGILVIERKQWFPYLEEYAITHGIALAAYREPLSGLRRIAQRFASLSKTLWAASRRAIIGRLRQPARRASASDRPDRSAASYGTATPSLAIEYVWKSFTVDPTDRSSSLYWLEDSGIPDSEVLLYGYTTSTPLSQKARDQLDSRRLRLLGQGPGVPGWSPTARWSGHSLRLISMLIRNLMACALRGQWPSPYYLRILVELAISYAYWYDFYASNRVLVNVCITDKPTVAQILALDTLGSISFSYQYTFGLVSDSSPLACAGENVQFVFSSVYAAHLRRADAPVDAIIDIGYTFDSAIRALRAVPDQSVRSCLQSNGARFIICFLDENSNDSWDFMGSNEDAAGEYEYLLNWLLADPSLGIVFKPKRPATLYTRIARIASLIERARRTGRCEFLMDFDPQSLASNTYAAAAALSADVCIGSLFGTTAALEARLAGVRTVLLDPIRNSGHPFHAWGLDHIVFNDWKTLRAAIERFRNAPESATDFGDWSRALHHCDPFQDGKAQLRMGQFIRTAYEALKQGKSREESLAAAVDQFFREWGPGHVSTERRRGASSLTSEA